MQENINMETFFKIKDMNVERRILIEISNEILGICIYGAPLIDDLLALQLFGTEYCSKCSIENKENKHELYLTVRLDQLKDKNNNASLNIITTNCISDKLLTCYQRIFQNKKTSKFLLQDTSFCITIDTLSQTDSTNIMKNPVEYCDQRAPEI